MELCTSQQTDSQRPLPQAQRNRVPVFLLGSPRRRVHFNSRDLPLHLLNKTETQACSLLTLPPIHTYLVINGTSTRLTPDNPHPRWEEPRRTTAASCPSGPDTPQAANHRHSPSAPSNGKEVCQAHEAISPWWATYQGGRKLVKALLKCISGQGG
ncbi:hypothetical protein AOXY_G22230 [Acipenser oxyrinchus oxyrinchus]|uniref:Uncharacterized protein n=1 Tax=Acipenser oxyrinchus oxyrinchus TaxID=40147 RepID=A0AAD8CZ33_ACIOX|nr:hypothetical protein AOXY_G22230 [Acipenser oxyrinchus oxyrinchus]